MMKKNTQRWVVGLAILAASLGNIKSMAQCDYPAPASFTLDHNSVTAGASVHYWLVGSDGKIKYSSATPAFANVASGTYKAWAYAGAAGNAFPANAIIGAAWASVAQACMVSKTAPINVCDNCSGLLTWGAVNSGANAASGYSTTYALVDNATGLIVATNNSTASFAAPFNADLHQIWAFNFSGTPSGIAAGQPVAAVSSSTACLSQVAGPVYRACYDFSNLKLNGAGASWPDAYATIASNGHTVWLGGDADNPTIEYQGYNGATDARTSGLTVTEPGSPVPGDGSSASPFILNVSAPDDYMEFNLTVNGAKAAGSSSVYWAIWFDAGDNGSFTDADDIFETGTTQHGSPITVTRGFTIKNGGTSGGAAGGKIRAVATAIPTTFTKAQNAQVALINGEVEDYYVSYLSILPVTLTSFEAVKQGGNAILLWQTATEGNSKEFIIERSPDGQGGWVAIGSVAAAGSSTTASRYSFADGKPLAGANYYRLRAVDKDGKSSASAVRMLDFSVATATALSPNPARDFVNITGLPEKSQVLIYDRLGKLVRQQAPGGPMARVSLGGLPAGTYLARVMKDGKAVFVGKFIKL